RRSLQNPLALRSTSTRAVESPRLLKKRCAGPGGDKCRISSWVRTARRSVSYLKRKAKAKMERTKIFARLAIGIPSVVEADRTDGQFVTQSGAERIVHLIKPGFLRCRQKIPSIVKERALQFTENRKRVLNVEDGEELAT